MSPDRGSALASGEGEARHIPVLLNEVLCALNPRSGGLYADGTFGAGGYTKALLSATETRVLALDRDPSAVAEGAALAATSNGRLTLERARFGDLDSVAERLNLTGFDGATFDIGVSSMQIDAAHRGFSFRFDGPLDMRMEPGGRSAADLLNEDEEETLADIFYHYGEERMARRVARAVVADRKTAPFTSTRRLAELAGRLIPHRPTDIHPATRVFQALRIAVNDELGQLVRGLAAAERVLKTGGRLAVVSFHSLEDRIVKQFLAERSGRGRAASRLLPGEVAAPDPTFEAVSRQPVTAGPAELKHNPRARSAKLRFATRTAGSARAPDPRLLALATLPAHPGRPL